METIHVLITRGRGEYVSSHFSTERDVSGGERIFRGRVQAGEWPAGGHPARRNRTLRGARGPGQGDVGARRRRLLPLVWAQEGPPSCQHEDPQGESHRAYRALGLW